MALQYNLQKLGHGVPYNYDYPLRVNDFQYYITILFPIGWVGGLMILGSDASGLSKSNFGTESLSGTRGVGETYYSEGK